MAKFPNSYYPSFGEFHSAYMSNFKAALDSIDAAAVERAVLLVEKCIKDGKTIYVCGNGGSSAIANHLEVDWLKGIATGTPLKPRVISLCRLELITALGNDYNFTDIFWRQFYKIKQPGDLLIAMSASGNSPNMVHAVAIFHPCIVMTGFKGGALEKWVADNPHIHIDSENYGMCEDVFSYTMHEIAQYIRHANMNPDKIKETKF